ILVGAPEDDPFKEYTVTRPGAVYRCQAGRRGYPADTNNPFQACSVMEFDKNR
ncbi:jg1161, partial [Pararge aegeria aegeria]